MLHGCSLSVVSERYDVCDGVTSVATNKAVSVRLAEVNSSFTIIQIAAVAYLASMVSILVKQISRECSVHEYRTRTEEFIVGRAYSTGTATSLLTTYHHVEQKTF